MSLFWNVVGVESRPPALPTLPAITRYVAPESGDDGNDGLTELTPWLYPPGDSRATHGYTPVPGDHIAFKGGEVWQGRIASPPAGLEGSPIIWSGNAWGVGRCRMDGASATGLTNRAATDQADAGGNTNWANPAVRIIEFSDDGEATWLYDDIGGLARSQFPKPLDPYAFDDSTPDGYHFDLTDPELAGIVAGGFTITNAALADHVRDAVGEAFLWVKVSGNAYNARRVTDVTGDTVTVENVAWTNTPYGANFQAIFVQDVPTDVTQAGEWALLSPTKALVWTRSGGGAIRRGVWTGSANVINPQAYNTIRGFEVVGHSENTGTGLWRRGSGLVLGWQFLDNHVHDCKLHPTGSQVIGLSNLGDVHISQNRFEKLYPRAGAVTTAESGCLIDYNIFNRIGATPVRLFSRSGTEPDGIIVRRNIICKALGVHSNGLASYQDCNGLLVEENIIFDSNIPLTIQGTCLNDGRVFRRNVLVATAAGNGWGLWFNGGGVDLVDCVVQGNLSVAWAAGFLLKQALPGLTFTGNWGTDGVAGNDDPQDYPGTAVEARSPNNQSGWTVSGNTTIADTYMEDVSARLEPYRCNIPFPDGTQLGLDLRTVGA